MSNNIVKHDQLEDIARDLWTKAKARDIEDLTYDPTTKTITGTNSSTNAGNNALSIPVQLTNLVSIDEKAEFKQDVSSDNVAITNNKYMGSNIGFESKDRSLGFRQLTTSAFVDGYVDHIRIYVDNANDSPTSTWKVWAITKGANGKESDTVNKVIPTAASLKVNSIVDGSETKKFVIIPVKESFENETYFIVRCDTHKLEVSQDIKTAYRKDVVNLNKSQPPDTANATIDWTYNADNNTAIMYLYGRESIGSLSLKLNQLQADGSKYVLQSETAATGGAGSANKVARLDNNGKLHTDMLPSIAINDYIPASAFTHAVLSTLEFQNGDIVVVTANGKVTRYLCVDKAGHQNNLTEAFIPLNDKEGIVFSVNEQRPGANGDVTVRAEHIKYTNGQNTTVKEELDKKISNIALKTGDNKQLTITKADGQISDVNLAEAFKADNISYSGTIGGAERNNVKAAIDALRDEANKGIKKINNGEPDNQGNVVVTATQSGTGISMTFGTNGTAVNVVTYMTETEVNQIKDLFV